MHRTQLSTQHASGGSSTNALAHKLAEWRHRLRVAAQAPSTTTTHSSSSRHFCRHRSPCVPQLSSARSRASATVVAAAASAAQPTMSMPLTVGQVVEVNCQRLGTGGVGVCLWGDNKTTTTGSSSSKFVLLVKGALPGERLTARITTVKKNYAEAQKLATLSPHTDAVAPVCQHFGTCGGCSLQSLAYQSQLAHKSDYVGQIFTRVGKLDAAAVAATQQLPVAADALYGYRNKLQMAFSILVWQEDTRSSADGCGAVVVNQQQQQGSVQQGFGLGFFMPGSSSVVLPVQQCSLVSPDMNAVVTQVRQLCLQHGLQPHNSPDGKGVLRHLIVRSAAGAGGGGGDSKGTAGVTPSSAPAPASASPASTSPSTLSAGAAAAFSNPPSSDQQAAGTPKLLAVLVTTPNISKQPQAKQALAQVAQQLMATCPGLVGVVHSIEASAPAGAAAVGGRGGSRRGGSQAGKQKHANRARKQRDGRSFSDSSSSSSSSSSSMGSLDEESSSSSSSGGDGGDGSAVARGAQPLRVQSSDVLAGVGTLVESMCGLNFQVSPHSFFQTNTPQAEQLYRVAVEAAVEAVGGSDAPGGVVLDLFCGTGTIAACLAAAMPQQQVVGVDVSRSAIADAQANAALNRLANVRFVCGDLNRLLGSGKKQQQDDSLPLTNPRVVVVDPARAGLGAGVVDYLVNCGAQRLVYVSCNAATQARDLQRLTSGGGFRLVSWRCVDLFPQTDVGHVETVVVLDRRQL